MTDNNNEMPKPVIGLLTGLIGVLSGFMLRQVLPSFEGVDILNVYQRENKPAVARHYRKGLDSIVVQDSANKNQYVVMSKYLATIADEGERVAEEVEIKKTVGWYIK